MKFTVADIARHLGAEVLGDGSMPLTGFATADAATTGDLTFAENDDYFARAEKSAAAAILVPSRFTSTNKILIRVPNARVGFAKVLPLFFPEPVFAAGIHATAVVAASAQIDPTAHIGPLCVVGERAHIGPHCVLENSVSLGSDCRLAGEVRLFPHVTVYPRTQIGSRVRIHAGAVVGADGFGYVFDQGRHLKVPQIGIVTIGDDVEIGANVTIDRGALGATVIGKGTKIDNLVQVAHNVTLGEHCILCAQVGIAGSVRVGNYVTMAGQVGLAGHIQIGHQVTIGGQSGVKDNIPDGEKWLGSPAQPDRQTKRTLIALQRLPELVQRVRALEKQMGTESPDGKGD